MAAAETQLATLVSSQAKAAHKATAQAALGLGGVAPRLRVGVGVVIACRACGCDQPVFAAQDTFRIVVSRHCNVVTSHGACLANIQRDGGGGVARECVCDPYISITGATIGVGFQVQELENKAKQTERQVRDVIQDVESEHKVRAFATAAAAAASAQPSPNPSCS